MTTLSFLGVLLLFGLSRCEEFTWCQPGLGGAYWEIPKKVSCESCLDGKISRVVPVEVEVWVPNLAPTVIPSYRCTIRERQVCTYMSFFGGKGLISDVSMQQATTVEECRYAFEQGMWKEQRVSPVSPVVNATRNQLTVSYQWCCYTYCNAATNFVVERGSVFLSRDKVFHSDLMSTVGCHAELGTCISPQGTLVWDARNLTSACPFLRKGVFRGSVNKDRVIVDGLQMAVTLKGKVDPASKWGCVGKVGFYQTDQGILLRFEKGNLSFAQEPLANYVIKETDPVNSKMQYLEVMLQAEMHNGFNQLWTQHCHASQHRLDIVWQLLRLDATLGARAAFQRSDIVAEFAGDALRVVQCRKVNVTRVINSHRVNDTCYAFTPVFVGDAMFFIVPGTRELQLTSPMVECKHVPVGIFKEGGTWVSSIGQVSVHTVPMHFVWRATDAPIIFEAPALYDDGVHGLANLLLAVHDRNYQTQILANRLDRLINYTSAYAVDPALTRHVLLGIGEGAQGVLQGLGSFWNTTGHAIVSVPGQLLHGLLTGPVQWLLNAALIVGAIVGTFYIGYRLFLWHQAKKALAPFSLPLSQNRLANRLAIRRRRHSIETSSV